MHVSVLLDEVMHWLEPKPGGRYIDGTLGGAGHAQRILELSSPSGKLLGLDADPEAIARSATKLAPYGGRVELVRANFRDVGSIAPKLGFGQSDGLLLDLGLSSFQLSDARRGFSFQEDGPLDMRLDPEMPVSAWDLVNNLEQDDLANIIWEFGDERQSRRIARSIVAHRPIETTAQLAAIVKASYRSRQKIHPATRTFQALRIAVNEEFKVLREALGAALNVLRPGGRLAVIAFHSGEDRIVKRFMQRESSDCVCPPEAPVCTCEHKRRIRVLTRRPFQPTKEEIERNPRSRSARLRVAEILSDNQSR